MACRTTLDGAKLLFDELVFNLLRWDWTCDEPFPSIQYSFPSIIILSFILPFPGSASPNALFVGIPFRAFSSHFFFFRQPHHHTHRIPSPILPIKNHCFILKFNLFFWPYSNFLTKRLSCYATATRLCLSILGCLAWFEETKMK
jgi:hypothetical protein